MSQFRCACVNVDMGSYANQIALHPPFPVGGGVVGIDHCIADEIQALWALGIQTCNSCCGHNVAPPAIMVAVVDEARMEMLGYEDWWHGDSRHFYPKSIALAALRCPNEQEPVAHPLHSRPEGATDRTGA